MKSDGSKKPVISRTRLDPEERREQILGAALEAFHVKGYGQTSVRDLGQAVGMSVAGMYHYFPTKEDILFAIIDNSVDRLVLGLEGARASADSPEDRLRAMLAETVRIVIEHRAEIRILIDNADKLPTERQEQIRRKRAESAAMVRAELERLRAAGRLADHLDLNVITFSINGMANWVYHWYRPEGPMGVGELTDQMSDIFLNGILR
ncbi:MAG: TetR/AcrR family transcriptional regulator [Thermoleophilia bacterium]|nr:TetR/AcrR family transcriptional regulator [Thermoleophilia bacterium]